MEFRQFQTTKKMKDGGIKSGHRKGPPSMGKGTALFTIRRLMTKTCLSLVLWVPGLFLILRSGKQLTHNWIPPKTLLITGKTNQIQYLRLPEP